jgi:glycosyltransferase involved in cell wall biosynthesis
VKEQIDFILPSFHSETLTTLAIKSFEKFKGDFDFRYIVVENSDDVSYKENVLALSENVIWIQNPTTLINSEANASGLEVGLEYVTGDYVFFCHNDVVACHPEWMNFLFSKLNDKCKLAGTVLDNVRINAVHVSGYLTTTEIAKSSPLYPEYKNGIQTKDVGDGATEYCRKNNLRYFCCQNTENDDILVELCEEPFRSFRVDRALNDDNEVIFLHLGRGTPKAMGTYTKQNRIYLEDWVKFINMNVLNES